MKTKNNFLKKYLWLIALFIGAAGVGFIWFFLPHQSQIEEFWWLAVKFIIYFIVVLGIAFFPNRFAPKFRYLLTCLPFFPLLVYIIPRASYFGIFGTLNTPEQGEMYTNLYFLLYPLCIMAVAFALRMGGGKPGECIKICAVGIILIFSGILDLSFNTAHGEPLAKSLDYAYHIIILFGRALTWKEGLFFCLAHIPLIVIVILLPLDKWFDKLGLEDYPEAKN